MVRGAWWWGLGLGLGLVACEQGYPIPATFCDDWCELVRRSCPEPYDPGQCVAACEEEKLLTGRDNCSIEQMHLVDCAKATPGGEPICITNPNRDGACEAEQDALHVCYQGGPELFAATNCEYLCSNFTPGHVASAVASSCPDTCVTRGFGGLECETERDDATNCLFWSCDRPDADPTICIEDDCQTALAALDACGARVVGSSVGD